MTISIRRSSRSLSPGRIRELKQLAERIDRDEAAAIKSRGRSVKARFDAMRNIVQVLRAERERLGLSLTEVGERSGIGKANLSRLENELDPNPTIDTLMRYADALNKEIRIGISDGIGSVRDGGDARKTGRQFTDLLKRKEDNRRRKKKTG